MCLEDNCKNINKLINIIININVDHIKLNMATKYYAVAVGRTPGIYTDWPTTEQMVKGFSKAIYKSFPTIEEANKFIEQNNAVISQSSTEYSPHTSPLPNKNVIYTDGSHINNACGFGVVILASNGDKYTAYGKVPNNVAIPAPTNNIGELYAIYVALSLMQGDAIIYTDSKYCILCITSYIHKWMKNNWKKSDGTDVANVHLITGIYNKMQNRDVTFKHVSAHTGIELNEEADKLSKQGATNMSELIIQKNGMYI